MIIIAQRVGDSRKFLVGKEKAHPMEQVGKVVDLDRQTVEGEETLVQSILQRGYWGDPGELTEEEIEELKRLSGYLD